MDDQPVSPMGGYKPSTADETRDFDTTDDAGAGATHEPQVHADEGVHWLEDPPLSYMIIKRAIDIVGSGCALLIFAPLLLTIALAIKLTSKGPIIVRQTRLGRHGVHFQFLKFRTMFVSDDSNIHKSYVEQLISGQLGAVGETPFYKIRHDPRITPVGRFLRRTSLDELPQFWNVFRGDMSLVGPRPPFAYEWSAYDSWHKQRLSTVPGITGLWQIEGLSATTFDEMVKMDIEYIKRASLLLDLKILLMTPVVVLRGEQAL